MEPQQPNALLQLMPMILLAIPFGLMTRSLAIEKGKKVAKWTFIGFIPIVGFFAFYYIVGATNERLERKIDALLNAQGHRPETF